MYLTLSHLCLPIIPEMNSRKGSQTEEIDEQDVTAGQEANTDDDVTEEEEEASTGLVGTAVMTPDLKIKRH